VRIVLVLLALLASGVAAIEGAVPCDVAAISPECYVAVRPGPTRDVLDLVEIPGEEVSSSAGELVLTTVAVQRDLDLGDILEVRRDPTVDRQLRSLYFPPEVDEEVTERAFEAMMQESELVATVAALRQLGYDLPPDGARVESVLPEGPSADLLEPGDVVVAVDGEPVTTSDGLAEAVSSTTPGTTVVLEVVLADGSTQERELVVGENPEDPSLGFAGLFVSTAVDVPIELEFQVEGIGGPSAGLMFALTIVDLLVEEDLTDGRVVAGTGEITFDGRVGPIGGIRQKLPGAVQRSGEEEAESATVFLLPRGNVEEARLAVPGSDLLLVPVDTLDDAVEALRALARGETPQDSFTLPAEGLAAASAG
jgi:PDZ domain-containing protein